MQWKLVGEKSDMNINIEKKREKIEISTTTTTTQIITFPVDVLKFAHQFSFHLCQRYTKYCITFHSMCVLD